MRSASAAASLVNRVDRNIFTEFEVAEGVVKAPRKARSRSSVDVSCDGGCVRQGRSAEPERIRRDG